MLPNKSVMTEAKAWAWHRIMSGEGATQVPFPKIETEIPEREEEEDK